MTRVLIAFLAILFATGALPVAMMYAAGPPPAEAATESQPSPHYDTEAERQLLEMANRARAKAGLPPLQLDEGLAKAARAHATAMAAQRKLSHRLSGEPNLPQRLAAHTETHLDRAGENVAFAGSVDQAQDSLMHSPPHRANLLNAGYNVAGFSVVRSGSLLYVAQDFGHSLPSHSVNEAQDLVATSVDRMRAQTRLPALLRVSGEEAEAAACSMAEANSLNTPALRARHVLRYTSSQPQTLPASASQAIADRSVHAFAVGSCYARTSSYPTGVYWVALLFY
jgi:uncharacterized protein YkwD